jgi:hypothetical protein
MLYPDIHLVAAREREYIEWVHDAWQGPQIAYPMPHFAANEWLQVTGQGVFVKRVGSSDTFRYFATFDNTKGRETAVFRIQVGGLT